jgi:hypothetical protein
MSDDAVKAKTGKTWNGWFKILDKAGADKMPHKEIAEHLHDSFGIPGWWSQMVTVEYEQARGLREKHQRASGLYDISVSRTLAVPVGTLFDAWHNEVKRNRWLPKTPITIRKATKDKSMRIAWKDGKTSLEVNFYGKGAGKSQVVVQHSKLPDAKAAVKMKAYWSKALDGLRVLLEK